MDLEVYLGSDSAEADSERRICRQAVYLGRAPITRVEKTGKDGQKSEQGLVS